MKKECIVDVPFGKTKEQHNKYYARWREINRKDYNEKRIAWANKYRERRTRQARNSHLKVKFGITLDEYNKMVSKQDNKCAICNLPVLKRIDKQFRNNDVLYIDHNHNTGKIRGLLCNKCNSALGLFQDNIDNLKSAVKYLKKHDKAINSNDLIINK